VGSTDSSSTNTGNGGDTSDGDGMFFFFEFLVNIFGKRMIDCILMIINNIIITIRSNSGKPAGYPRQVRVTGYPTVHEALFRQLKNSSCRFATATSEI
jgi:hypothetical protein